MRKLIRSLTSTLLWDFAKKKIFSFWVVAKINWNIFKRVYSRFDINFLACHRSLKFETESDFCYLIVTPYHIDEEVDVKVPQLCPTLCGPMDCTIHRILQARILEWVTFPFTRGSSQPRGRTQISRIAGGFLTSWAPREARMGGKWDSATSGSVRTLPLSSRTLLWPHLYLLVCS